MTRLLLFSITLFTLFACNKKPEKLVFYDGSLGQLEEQAKGEEKPYYLYFSADWCGPCQVLKKNVFSIPEVYDYSNENYLAFYVDVDEFNGQELSKRYEVDGIPTFIFFNSNGKYLGQITGGMNSQTFLEILEEYNQP
jgi:thioredoxin-related protein